MFESISIRKVKKARRRKQCDWCNQFIEVGESMTRYVGKNDGDFQSTLMHNDCYSAMQSCDFIEDGFDEGSFKRGTCDER